MRLLFPHGRTQRVSLVPPSSPRVPHGLTDEAAPEFAPFGGARGIVTGGGREEFYKSTKSREKNFTTKLPRTTLLTGHGTGARSAHCQCALALTRVHLEKEISHLNLWNPRRSPGARQKIVPGDLKTLGDLRGEWRESQKTGDRMPREKRELFKTQTQTQTQSLFGKKKDRRQRERPGCCALAPFHRL